MPQEVLRQSNFNGGELSPQAIGRRDLKAYASSLALCVNMIPMAEGPIRRRPGLAHVDVIRNRLEAVEITGAMLTAPNGGVVADLMSGAGMVTTATIDAAEPHVLLEIDFGAPTTVGMIDLTNFAIVDAGSGGGGDPGNLPDPTPPQYPWNGGYGDRPLEVLP